MNAADAEADVLAALDRGDVAAAATLALRAYGPQIYGYIAAVVRDEDAAADAFAAFSEDLWLGLPAFRREASIRTWAYKLAWHATLKVARDPYKRRARALPSSAYSEIAAQVRTDTAVHLRTETKDRLAELRASLSPEEQSLLVLRLDRQLSWRDVALAMGGEEAALRKRFERIKERLRAMAKERGLLGS